VLNLKTLNDILFTVAANNSERAILAQDAAGASSVEASRRRRLR